MLLNINPKNGESWTVDDDIIHQLTIDPVGEDSDESIGKELIDELIKSGEVNRFISDYNTNQQSTIADKPLTMRYDELVKDLNTAMGSNLKQRKPIVKKSPVVRKKKVDAISLGSTSISDLSEPSEPSAPSTPDDEESEEPNADEKLETGLTNGYNPVVATGIKLKHKPKINDKSETEDNKRKNYENNNGESEFKSGDIKVEYNDSGKDKNCDEKYGGCKQEEKPNSDAIFNNYYLNSVKTTEIMPNINQNNDETTGIYYPITETKPKSITSPIISPITEKPLPIPTTSKRSTIKSTEYGYYPLTTTTEKTSTPSPTKPTSNPSNECLNAAELKLYNSIVSLDRRLLKLLGIESKNVKNSLNCQRGPSKPVRIPINYFNLKGFENEFNSFNDNASGEDFCNTKKHENLIPKRIFKRSAENLNSKNHGTHAQQNSQHQKEFHSYEPHTSTPGDIERNHKNIENSSKVKNDENQNKFKHIDPSESLSALNNYGFKSPKFIHNRDDVSDILGASNNFGFASTKFEKEGSANQRQKPKNGNLSNRSGNQNVKNPSESSNHRIKMHGSSNSNDKQHTSSNRNRNSSVKPSSNDSPKQNKDQRAPSANSNSPSRFTDQRISSTNDAASFDISSVSNDFNSKALNFGQTNGGFNADASIANNFDIDSPKLLNNRDDVSDVLGASNKQNKLMIPIEFLSALNNYGFSSPKFIHNSEDVSDVLGATNNFGFDLTKFLRNNDGSRDILSKSNNFGIDLSHLIPNGEDLTKHLSSINSETQEHNNDEKSLKEGVKQRLRPINGDLFNQSGNQNVKSSSESSNQRYNMPGSSNNNDKERISSNRNDRRNGDQRISPISGSFSTRNGNQNAKTSKQSNNSDWKKIINSHDDGSDDLGAANNFGFDVPKFTQNHEDLSDVLDASNKFGQDVRKFIRHNGDSLDVITVSSNFNSNSPKFVQNNVGLNWPKFIHNHDDILDFLSISNNFGNNLHKFNSKQENSADILNKFNNFGFDWPQFISHRGTKTFSTVKSENKKGNKDDKFLKEGNGNHESQRLRPKNGDLFNQNGNKNVKTPQKSNNQHSPSVNNNRNGNPSIKTASNNSGSKTSDWPTGITNQRILPINDDAQNIKAINSDMSIDRSNNQHIAVANSDLPVLSGSHSIQRVPTAGNNSPDHGDSLNILPSNESSFNGNSNHNIESPDQSTNRRIETFNNGLSVPLTNNDSTNQNSNRKPITTLSPSDFSSPITLERDPDGNLYLSFSYSDICRNCMRRTSSSENRCRCSCRKS